MPRPRFPKALLASVLVVAPVVVGAFPVRAADESAKPAEGPAGRGERPAGRLPEPGSLIDRVTEAAKGLSLSKEQLDKVTEAGVKAKSALAEAAKAASGEGRARMTESMKVISEFRESINASLTDEQKQKLAEAVPFLSRMAAAPGGERRPPGAPERPNAERPNAERPNAERPNAPRSGQGDGSRMAAMSRAAEAVLAKLDLSDDQKAKIKSLNEKLEAETKKLIAELKEDRQAIAEKMRPLMEERRQKMSEILSPEQMQKFQEGMRQQLQNLRPGGEGGRRPNGERRPDAAKPQEKPAEKPAEKSDGEKK